MTSSSFFLNTYMCTCYYIIYRISPKRRQPNQRSQSHSRQWSTRMWDCCKNKTTCEFLLYCFVITPSLWCTYIHIFTCIWTESTFCYRYQVVVVCQIKSTACIYFISIFCVHHLSISI